MKDSGIEAFLFKQVFRIYMQYYFALKSSILKVNK
jgi:hypothetical protein